MLNLCKYIFLVFIFSFASPLWAKTMIVDMYMTADSGMGKKVGYIQITETAYGLLFMPHLQGLTPGLHGFHLHENPSCDQKGMAAGGHYDPNKTGKHLGPYNDAGHLGDLPALFVDKNGNAMLPILAPRFKHVAQLKQHTLMIHEGEDNYADTPEKLGGGGKRMICGRVI